MDPVELTAGDLLLRAWRPSDADPVFRACQDPLIQHWTRVPVPYRLEHAAGFVGELTVRTWAAETSAPLGVFSAGTGELLASSGLVDLDLDDGSGELGVWVAPWARGRDVAERACRAVAHWAFEVLGLRVLVWRAQVGNHVSRLVGERIGFVFDGVDTAALRDRDGGLVDCWKGVLRPGRVQDTTVDWLAPGGPGARRARAFGMPPARVPAGPVTLRAPATRDVDDAVVACRDPETARWTTVPVPYGPENAEHFVYQRVPAGWASGTSATFAIADADDRFAGTIELRIDPADRSVAELGFLVAPWARGKGYGTAAAHAICVWGFEALGVSRIVWRAHLGNEASRRVAEKVGFRPEGIQRSGCEQRGERHDAWVAALLATDLLLDRREPRGGGYAARLITP
jgi:RimJ/RimL family protein N-acetyltransferase